VGAGARHLTSVDIVTGYGQMVTMDRFDAGPQPAGRAPAPGRLGLVQAFLNTFWDLDGDGAEVWDAPPSYAAWLADRGFGEGGSTAADVTGADLARAIEVREALRALALANHVGARVPGTRAEAVLDRVAADVAPRAGLTPRFGGGADRLDVAAGGPDGTLGLVLGVVFAARADGSWARMKACPHAHCGWVFYDRSRNRSSQWCSMRICGNRTKAARHRTRAAR
jgi:predicted RNA-binding Zn ribbon-like protein